MDEFSRFSRLKRFVERDTNWRMSHNEVKSPFIVTDNENFCLGFYKCCVAISYIGQDIVDSNWFSIFGANNKSLSANELWSVCGFKFLSELSQLPCGNISQAVGEISDYDRCKGCEYSVVFVQEFEDMPEADKEKVIGGAIFLASIIVLGAYISIDRK